ncbi:MAG: hypothetical protein ACOYN0_03675 [Phycisphaerales bacterium]
MAHREILGAVAGGCLGVIASVFVSGGFPGAVGGVCSLLGAAGALIAARPGSPGRLGAAGAVAVCAVAAVCGTVCSARPGGLRASDSDVLMTLAARKGEALVASGTLSAQERVSLASATNVRDLPPPVVIAAAEAWDRMPLAERARVRDEVTASKRFARGYLAAEGPFSVARAEDLATAGLGWMMSCVLVVGATRAVRPAAAGFVRVEAELRRAA